MSYVRRRENRPVVDEAIRYGAAIDSGVAQAKKAFKYASLAHSAAKLGYGLGQQFVNSFSKKNNNEMPPVTPKRRRSSTSSGSNPFKVTPKRKAIAAARNQNMLQVLRKRPTIYHTGRLAGRVKKGTRKISKRAYFEKAGVAMNFEYAATLDTFGLPSAVVGHGTFPVEQVGKVAVGALLKKLLAKMGLPVVSWGDFINATDFSTGDRFYFNYQVNPDGGENATFYQLLAGDIGSTFENLVGKLVAELFAVCKASVAGSGYLTFATLKYVPAANAAVPAVHKHEMTTLSLIGSKIQIYSKSDLKLQNQSVTVAADNQADNINNVPIYGKTYEGTGTGFKIMSRANNAAGTGGRALAYNISRTRGIIAVIGSSTDNIYEPWQRTQFRGVKRAGKIGINPGEIKSSHLTTSTSILFDDLMQMLFITTDGGNATPTNPTISRGKFRFMVLDKVIGLAGATGVKVAYENNCYIGCVFKPKYANLTSPLYTFVA